MRAELGEYIRRITTVPLPTAPNIPIIDYEVSMQLPPVFLILTVLVYLILEQADHGPRLRLFILFHFIEGLYPFSSVC